MPALVKPLTNQRSVRLSESALTSGTLGFRKKGHDATSTPVI
jgi:hypothetical protein